MNLEAMDNKIGIYNNCKKVLYNYGLPTEYLKREIDRHYSNKSWISEALGIHESDGYRLVFSLANTMDSRPLAVNLLHDMEVLSEGKYKMLDLQFMWKQKNKIRVTKIIQELWDALCSSACKEFTSIGHISNFASCCSSASLLHPLNMCSDEQAKEQYIHRFHVWYGDYVKNGRVAVLSLNPFDFITASDGDREYCGFTSCVRPDGEYANTILDYFASGCVAIMYTAKPENLNFKEGRCWVYIASDAVFQGRVYGSIFGSDLLLVRDYIQQKLLPDDNGALFGGDCEITARWTKRSGDYLHLLGDDVSHDGSGYIDYGYGIMSIAKGTEQRIFFEFGEGSCLFCGGGIDGNESGYACYSCAGSMYSCIECDRGIDEDDTCYVNGNGPYCEDCFNEVAFYCNSCSETYSLDDAVEVENGSNICESCFENLGFTCYHCERNFLHTRPYGCSPTEDYTTDIDGDRYCSRCASDYLINCADCGEQIHCDNSCTTHDDTQLCEGCFTNSTHKAYDGKTFYSETERDQYDEENEVSRQGDGERITACG